MEISEIVRLHRTRFEGLLHRKLSGEFLPKSEFAELWRLYLEQPEWTRLTELVGKRCGNRCEKCYHADYEECHHLTYDRRFREDLDDLLGVCRKCHSLFTKAQKQKKEGGMHKPTGGEIFLYAIRNMEEYPDRKVKKIPGLNSAILSALKWMGILDYRNNSYYFTSRSDHLKTLDDGVLKGTWKAWNSLSKVWAGFDTEIEISRAYKTSLRLLCNVNNKGKPKNEVRVMGRFLNPHFKVLLKSLSFNDEEIEKILVKLKKEFLDQDRKRKTEDRLTYEVHQAGLFDYKAQEVEKPVVNTVQIEKKETIMDKWLKKRKEEEESGYKFASIEEYKDFENFKNNY